jgi:uncharacterized repeat protein (TIGR01451 family)
MDYNPIGGKRPGLKVEKFADRAEARIGETINYTIVVNNTGDLNLTGVRAEDNLNSAVWEVGTLLPGENYTNTTSYLVNETDLPGPVTNELRANGTSESCGTVNVSAMETVEILYNASLNVTKTANTSGPVSLGDIIWYTINVTNTGDVNLTRVKVVDDLLGSGWPMVNLVPGEIDTFASYYKVKEQDVARGFIINNATANATDPCGKAVGPVKANVTIDVNKLCISGKKIINCPGADLSNWTITLYYDNWTQIDSNMTNDTGYYQFCGLDPGDYIVCETIKFGYTNVTPTCVNVSLYDNAPDIDFESAPLTCIGGYKLDTSGNRLANWTIFVDYNDSGTLDPGEPYNVTDADGRWQICDLVVGSVANFTEVLEAGWKPVNPASGWQLVVSRTGGPTTSTSPTSVVTTPSPLQDQQLHPRDDLGLADPAEERDRRCRQ